MRVGVVGGGITGLALTHALADRGVDCVTLEAADEPGGVIRSGRVDGALLEYGPQRTRLTDPVADLVSDVGLDDELVLADEDLPVYVYADGRLRRVPTDPRSFLRTDLLSWRGKLRALAEPLTARGRPEETAAELFGRKFGTEAYRNVVGPLFGGIYGSDPARMPARHALSRLLALEEREGALLWPALRRAFDGPGAPAASFEDGLQRLPEALASAHADRVRLGTPALALDRGDDGYELRTPDGGEAVDRVVVTAGADAAADLLAGVAPGAADALRRLRYNPLALVHLAADARPRGLGYQVRREEPLRTLGVTWNASAFGRSCDGRADRDRVAVGRGDGGRADAGRPDVGLADGGRGDGGDANHGDAVGARATDAASSERRGSHGVGGEGVYTCFLGGMDDPGAIDLPDDALGGVAAAEFERVVEAPVRVLSVTRLARGFPAWDRSWSALDDLELPDGIDLATNYTGRMGVPSRVRVARRLAERIASGDA